MTLATSSDRQNEMQLLLAKELELNGIRFDLHKWLASNPTLYELSLIVASEAHEGIIPSEGVMFVEESSELFGVEYVLVHFEQISMARKFANGVDCFLLYEKEIFFGLVYFKEPLLNELLLVRAFPPSGGLFVQRGSTGIVKFFQGNSIIILENRNWFTKPLIKEAAWKISRCASEINHAVLNRILEFSFHLLSPIPQVGATIVWWLKEIPFVDSEIQTTGQDISEFNFSILDEARAVTFCHFLSQIDGATFLNPEGKFTRTGIHLKNSNKSRGLIPELKGTRHTSAQRFSYDFSDTLVITVSSDGPVTIFSDGVNIANLRIHPSYKAAHDLKKMLPEKQEDITSSSYEVICQHCGKRLIVEQVNVVDWNKDTNLNCLVCQSLLRSANCFTIECRPFKRFDDKSEVGK
ncbi:MAG: diadenylate cyclase [Bacteriovorax sp.]|nr:diadenylate cyclase [Bacteriovorax sp.]